MKTPEKQIEDFLMEISYLWEEKTISKKEINQILDAIKNELYLINQINTEE